MKKVLVTGGVGFVGTNLCLRLVSCGYQVFAFDIQTQNKNAEELRNKEVRLIRGDQDDVGLFLRENSVDVIYHLAAQTAVTKSYESPRADFRVNAWGGFNISLESKGIPIIYASTNKVYGDNPNKIPIIELETRYDFANEFRRKGINEDFSIDTANHTPYGISKLTGELYIREAGGVANRFSCMYGGFQYGTEDQAWLSHAVRSKINNKEFTIYGNGKQIRDVLYIDDVVDLLIRQAENIDRIRGQAFNIGGGYENTTSIIELCELLKLDFRFDKERPHDQKVFYCDTTKAFEVLGWKPTIPKDVGIERLLKWSYDNFKTL